MVQFVGVVSISIPKLEMKNEHQDLVLDQLCRPELSQPTDYDISIGSRKKLITCTVVRGGGG